MLDEGAATRTAKRDCLVGETHNKHECHRCETPARIARKQHEGSDTSGEIERDCGLGVGLDAHLHGRPVA